MAYHFNIRKKTKTLINLYHNRKYVKIKHNVYLTGKCFFEGDNVVNAYSEIYNCSVGRATYVATNSYMRNCTIGKFCSIGNGVYTIYGKHPTSNWVSTHPAFFSKRAKAGITFTDENLFDEKIMLKDNYSILIGNDVWIGDNVSIMEGVKIGNGAIIGAGSLVVRDVAAYSIVCGVPATVKRYRFSKEEIDFLMKFNWWDKDYTWLKHNINYFKSEKEFYEHFREDKR